MRWIRVAIWLGIGGVFLVLLWNFFSEGKGLPRIRLPDGGEFRVFKVTYTSGPSEARDHAIGAAPRAAFWIWHHLPKSIQIRIEYPSTGIAYYSSKHPALSIWWAYIDPKTQKPELGPTDYVVTTLDSGEQLKPIWPEPTDEGYRQIFLTDPPQDSKRLRFRLMAEDYPVEFELENPAYRK